MAAWANCWPGKRAAEALARNLTGAQIVPDKVTETLGRTAREALHRCVKFRKKPA
ncbi:MAG: hypothetical protein ORN49_05085 [Rhodobacteraceae bacterium]|nr:hypothetical protein [Paracoccaceae bacterium]